MNKLLNTHTILLALFQRMLVLALHYQPYIDKLQHDFYRLDRVLVLNLRLNGIVGVYPGKVNNKKKPLLKKCFVKNQKYFSSKFFSHNS